MEKSPVAQTLDAIFSTVGDSPTHRRIFREVYGADYPEEAEPLSYLGMPELRRVAREIGVGTGRTIADFGCGRGGPGLWVARETGASLVGIDLSESAIEQAGKRAGAFLPAGRAQFQVGSLTALPFASEVFAGGMSVAVIWVIPNPGAALAEIARVLARAARFVFTDWDRTLSPAGAPPPIPDHRPLLEQAGFEVVSYEVVAGAEERRRQIYQRYLEHYDALERELGPVAARWFKFEAERALGVLDGIDYLACSEQIFVVAERA